jgi:hypothetical protein
MSTNPPPLDAELPPRFAADASADHDAPGRADAPHDPEHPVPSPRLLTPAVCRVLEWHRVHSTARH